ncbi:MAG: AsmA-like C-terminal region-containing protein [Elusimicrobiota bacterium]
MKGRRWVRILLLVGGAGLLLLAAAALTLRLLFPPEKVRSMAMERLQKALGREVRIASASVGLRGVDLTGLEVSEVPDFKAGTSLKAGRVRVRVLLGPLLRRREFQATEIWLDKWSIRIHAPHTIPKTAPGPIGRPGTAAAVTLPSFDIAHLSMTQGEVSYEDPRSELKVGLTGIGLDASDVSPDHPVPMRLDMGYSVRRGRSAYSGNIRYRGVLDLGRGDPARMSVELKPLAARLLGMEVELAGIVRDFASPEVDLALSVPRMNSSSLKGVVDLPPGLRLPSLKGAVKLRFAGETVEVRRLELTGGPMSVSLTGRGKGPRWELDPSKVRYQGMEMNLGGKVDLPAGGRKDIVADLRLETNRLSLVEAIGLYPSAAAAAPQGEVMLRLSAKGALSKPDLQGKAELFKVGASYAGHKVRDLDGEVSVTPKSLAASLKGELDGESLEFKATVSDFRGPRPSVRVDGRLSRLDLGKFVREKEEASPSETSSSTAPPPKRLFDSSGAFTAGRIEHPRFKSGEAKVDWDLKGLDPGLSGASGTIKLHVGEGSFEELKALAESKPLLKLLLLPITTLQRVAGLVKVPLFPRFDKVDFKEITGGYSLANGMLTVRESHLDSALADVSMTGTADLSRETLDLRVDTRLPVAQVSGPIGFKVSGSLADPKVKLDPLSILKQPEVEKVIDKGKELLKGLFKQP